jgi:MoxR-like ATPase
MIQRGEAAAMAEGSCRFPAPWRTDKIPGGHVVRDANGQALAYIYSRDNEAEARQAKVQTADEARRRGCVTLIAGEPGLGKSQLAARLAAQVSTGGWWVCT